DAQRPLDAKKYLDRVRLNGPFSNKALLASGWASVAMNKYENALATWSTLSRRNANDEPVQESKLGIPYAYGKLNLPGKAALYYSKAIEGYEQQLTRLDASIKSVREGKFLQAIQRDELRQEENLIARIKLLPDTPETYHLLELMASSDFRGSLYNYLDLGDLLVKLESWDQNLQSYEELVSLRRQYYGRVLPDIDKQFLVLDAKLKSLLLRRKNLDGILMGGPAKVQRKDENKLADAGNSAAEANQHHRQLDEDIRNLVKNQASTASLRQFVTQDYQGYDDQIRQIKTRVHDARQKVGALMARQGKLLETITIDELDQRRKRLREHQANATFALAESYERASKVQTK
ncbi:MAG: hypothetical protein OEV15_01035, partial [Gallionella sp.]|nr:hypothetical protein [Gallionella sp.]